MIENQLVVNEESNNLIPQEMKSATKVPAASKQIKDNRQMNKFISPMFGDLEKIIAEQMVQLDKLEEELFGNDKKHKLDYSIAHIPEAIRERKSIDTIMKNLEELIINTNESDPINEIDQSERKSQELLKEKFSSSTDDITKPLYNHNEDETLDLKTIKLSNLTCLAQSLSAYLVTRNSRRNGDKLKNITIKIYDSVNLWLSRLFRFDNSSVLFHDQEPDGFIRMCQIMLNCKYTDFQQNGYQVINRQPAIYISAASKYSLPEYRELISVQLGLPLSTIRIVQIFKTVDANLDKIDVTLFCKQIEDDLADGFVPLILVANAGSYVIGQCDDLNQLNQICYKYKMWIHLEGVYLSTLVLYSVPTEIQHVSSGDSITINLGEWLGLPSLSYVTLYRNVKNSNLYLQPFNSVISTLQRSLPYWCVLQAIGHQGVIEKIKNATDMTYYMTEITKKQKPYLKILDFKNVDSQETVTKINSLGELFSKALSLLTFVDLKNPIVVFKCDKSYIKERLYLFGSEQPVKPIIKETKIVTSKDEFLQMIQEPEPSLLYSKELKQPTLNNTTEKVNNNENNLEIKEYADTLTTWLCDLMNSLHKNIELELIEIVTEGICIRYSPLEHANIFNTNEHDIKLFDKSLEDIIAILDASIKCKSIFDKEIKEFPNLISVNIPKWAGIGAVRYIPDYLLNQLDEISKYLEFIKEKEFSTLSENKIVHFNEQKLNQDIKDINELNEQLVKALQAQDGAFSIGQAYDGLKAVKFGMVSELDVLKKLAGQVQDVGKTVEEESRFIEKMTELTRIGIEKANEDLKKENEAKLMQQGLFRQIPLINDVLKWWGPTDNVTISGRSFNLQSGKIVTTEVTYKYHMQVKENSKSNSDDKNKSMKTNYSDNETIETTVTDNSNEIVSVKSNSNVDFLKNS